MAVAQAPHRPGSIPDEPKRLIERPLRSKIGSGMHDSVDIDPFSQFVKGAHYVRSMLAGDGTQIRLRVECGTGTHYMD